MPMSQLRSAAVVLLAAFAGAALAQSANFPSQPIKIVVAAPAGGDADAIGRLLADRLQAQLKSPVIVDNKPGAGVTLASNYVAHSAPDGTNLLLGGSGMTASPALMKSAADPVKDFAPISQVAVAEMLAVVRADSNIRTLADLGRAGRSGGLNYGSAGNGSITHLQMEMLKSLANFEATHVAYKGTAPALTALLAGDIQIMFAGSSAMPFIGNGKLRAIAVASPTRSTEYPQVPTVQESYPTFDAFAWTGLLASADTPPAIVSRLNTAVAAVVADPAFVVKMNSLGNQARSSTPDAMAERIKGETARLGALARSIGITPQ